jgi:EmrB/QacA subfamily drug resistance transporter
MTRVQTASVMPRRDDDTHRLLRPGVPAWVATMIAAACSFMVVMDGTIVNVALPSIRSALDMSASGQQWVVSAYLLALGGLLMLAARAGDIYGRKTVLLAGVAAFTLASLAGGLAPSGLWLIVARAVQGCGAAGLATTPLSIVALIYPQGHKRSQAIGLIAACGAGSAAVGVTLGGFLVSAAGWRWVMFVNVPIGAVLAALCWVSFEAGSRSFPRGKVDPLGALLVTAAVALVVYALTASISNGWFSLPVLLAMAAGAACMIGFLTVERRSADPLIGLAVFSVRNIPVGLCMSATTGAALTASTYFLSQFLQRLAGLDALHAGVALVPLALALAVAAIGVGRFRNGNAGRLAFCGGCLAAYGFAALALIPPTEHSVTRLIIESTLVGAGLGTLIVTATSAVLAGVPSSQSGLATGLQNTARQLGGSLGIAVLATVAHGVSANGTSAELSLPGFQAAFLGMAVLAVMAAGSALMLRSRGQP